MERDYKHYYLIIRGRLYYYRQEKEPTTQQWSTTYIKKNQMSLAIELAEKGYLITVAAVLKSQIALLQEFVQKYNEEAVEEIYRNLPDERKALVEPVAIGVKEKLEAWDREEYEPYTGFKENLIYETNQGEKVRSKSELIIANVLYQYKDDIEYKYERPLELKMHIPLERNSQSATAERLSAPNGKFVVS